MAASETIRSALCALEMQSADALNLAQCFVAAAGDQGLDEPPWIHQFTRLAYEMSERVEALAQAINAEGK